MTLAIHRSNDHLGAPPPEIILKALNTGFSKNHLKLDNPFAYTFTRALVYDLEEIFGQQQAHGLFLCEMGSQKLEEVIDIYLKARYDAVIAGTYVTPVHQEEYAFCDQSRSLQEYLTLACQAASRSPGADRLPLRIQRCRLQVLTASPYAYIGDPQKLSVSPPERFTTVPGNTQRHGVRYDVVYLPTGDQFPVACNHSPSSPNWDLLTPAKKKLCFVVACRRFCSMQLTHSRHPPMARNRPSCI